jgi:Fe-S-cluster containining protein
MSMNSSGLIRQKQLANSILGEFTQISSEFSTFQNNAKLSCIEGCGKCCFKPDIYCSPYELLPLALELLEKGEAQKMYERCLDKQEERCLFLTVTNEEKFKAQCEAYTFRPLVCRTFGVSARHGKNQRVDMSVCKPLQEQKTQAYEELLEKAFSITNLPLPFIDLCKSRLTSLDPALQDEEFPINQALKIMLEKVLFYANFNNGDTINS